MTSKDLKVTFAGEVKKNVFDPKHKIYSHKNDDSKLYYPEEYGDVIVKEFKSHGVNSNEVIKQKGKPTPICSVCSSGRLCYLNFKKVKGIRFEYPLYNDVDKLHPSKLDAYEITNERNIFYECKCQEILNNGYCGEKELLSDKYLKSKYFRELKIESLKVFNKYGREKDGSYTKGTDRFIHFELHALEINLNKDLYLLRFNLKQLICHLIAIAKYNVYCDRASTLQYIFYKPKTNNKDILKIYDELTEELKAIWDSSKIKNYCKKYHIDLKYKFINISDIKDDIYGKTF